MVATELNKRAILDALKRQSSAIRRFGVRKIGLFGSYSRDQQGTQSDIDLLVSFDPANETFDNFMGLCFFLDELFPEKKVEVVTPGSLSERMAAVILPTVEYVPFA